MSKIVSIAVAVLVLVGWVVYLAGVAQSTNLCVKVGKGDILLTELIKSGPESPDKDFMPLGQPWGQPKYVAISSTSTSSSSTTPSGTPSSTTGTGLTAAQQAQIAAALAQAAALQGRRLMSYDNEMLFPSHARSLMGVIEDNCGWTYSFAWWTVALQGLATIGLLLIAFGFIPAFKPTFTAFIYVNSALLCGIAYTVVPLAANLNATKVKGKYPDAVAASAAGVIIVLIANFAYFITLGLDGGDGTVAPAKQ